MELTNFAEDGKKNTQFVVEIARRLIVGCFHLITVSLVGRLLNWVKDKIRVDC